MTSINFVTLDVQDATAADQFYSAAFGLDEVLRFTEQGEPSTGFRGFTLSLTVSQPGNVDFLITSALEAGATMIKPAAKSLWGYGGVVQAPDGAIWKVATSKKRDTVAASATFDELVLLIGATDVSASKRFYADSGIAVAKSYGRTYVQFATPASPIQFGLYGFKALAKDAGLPAEGTGSHRLVVNSDAGTFTDPDGFTWSTQAN